MADFAFSTMIYNAEGTQPYATTTRRLGISHSFPAEEIVCLLGAFSFPATTAAGEGGSSSEAVCVSRQGALFTTVVFHLF